MTCVRFMTCRLKVRWLKVDALAPVFSAFTAPVFSAFTQEIVIFSFLFSRNIP